MKKEIVLGRGYITNADLGGVRLTDEVMHPKLIFLSKDFRCYCTGKKCKCPKWELVARRIK